MFDGLSRREFIKVTGGFAAGAAAAGSAPLIETLTAQALSSTSKKVYKFVGYFGNWAQYRQGGGKFFPDQIDPSLFTHINFAFGMFGFVSWSVDPSPTRTGNQRYTGDYTIQPVEWNDQTVLYRAMQNLKKKNPNLKTILSIGGWSFNSCDDTPESAGTAHPYGPFTCKLFSKMAADPSGRRQFINSAIAYAKKYGFDGIDLDWEYPADSARGGQDADYNNYLTLLKEFRQTAGQNFIITIASAAVPKGSKTGDQFFLWLAQCSQYLDWFNVMSYDYHGAFDDPKTMGTGVNAPLLKDSVPNGTFDIKDTVDAYLKANIPKEKIVLGMPTYGRSYVVANRTDGYGKPFSGPGPAGAATATPGILAYFEILKKIANGELDVQKWDDATLTPYTYSSKTGLWVSYDNPKSLAYKVSYLIKKELGGAMVWAIDLDDFAKGFPLIKALKGILDNPASAPSLPSNLVEGSNNWLPNNWMANIPNSKKLSQLTIPGTHDSCTYTLKNGYALTPITRTQHLTLEEQLNAGIRFIDIRCRHISNAFAIHHGSVYLKLNFDDVLKVCTTFLTKNRNECIVMSVKSEYKDGSGVTRTFEATFDSYLQGNSKGFWYLGDNIPNLKDVRGKIVLLRRFGLDNRANRTGTKGIDASAWADNATFTINNNAHLKIQDEYVVKTILPKDINPKWNGIKSLLDEAKSDASDTWFINFSSGASLGAYPNAVAGRMNYRISDYIGDSPKFAHRLGTIVVDFPDDKGKTELVNRIIKVNFPPQ